MTERVAAHSEGVQALGVEANIYVFAFLPQEVSLQQLADAGVLTALSVPRRQWTGRATARRSPWQRRRPLLFPGRRDGHPRRQGGGGFPWPWPAGTPSKWPILDLFFFLFTDLPHKARVVLPKGSGGHEEKDKQQF